jgi:hypothetical protein
MPEAREVPLKPNIRKVLASFLESHIGLDDNVSANSV